MSKQKMIPVRSETYTRLVVFKGLLSAKQKKSISFDKAIAFLLDEAEKSTASETKVGGEA